MIRIFSKYDLKCYELVDFFNYHAVVLLYSIFVKL